MLDVQGECEDQSEEAEGADVKVTSEAATHVSSAGAFSWET